MLDVAFAVVVPGMGLASEDKLDRPLRVVDQLHDVVELLKDERGALVRGKATREPDGERVGIEQLIEGDEIALTEAAPLDQQTPAGKLDQFPAQLVAQSPDLLVGKEVRVGHFLPERRV